MTTFLNSTPLPLAAAAVQPKKKHAKLPATINKCQWIASKHETQTWMVKNADDHIMRDGTRRRRWKKNIWQTTT